MLLTCLLPVLATERSRVLDKKVNETQVSKTVFSHLNMPRNVFVTAIVLKRRISFHLMQRDWNENVARHVYCKGRYTEQFFIVTALYGLFDWIAFDTIGYALFLTKRRRTNCYMHVSYSVATFWKMILYQHINRDEEKGIAKPAVFSIDRRKGSVDFPSSFYDSHIA